MSDYSFEFTGETKVNLHGYTVWQIRATRDIPRAGVKKGDIGGWIESSDLANGDPRVSGNAWVYGNAQVYGNARVSDDVQVYGNARVYGSAWVSGSARVYGNAQVYGDVQVYGNARVSGNAQVSGSARVYGNAQVYGNAWVYGDARMELPWHYIAVGPIGSEGVTATIFRTKNGKHIVNVGCWDGTLGQLMAEVKRRRENWGGTEAEHEVWVAQYKALRALGKATVARWAVER